MACRQLRKKHTTNNLINAFMDRVRIMNNDRIKNQASLFGDDVHVLVGLKEARQSSRLTFSVNRNNQLNLMALFDDLDEFEFMYD